MQVTSLVLDGPTDFIPSGVFPHVLTSQTK